MWDEDGEARNGAWTRIILSKIGAKQNPATRGTTQSQLFKLGLFEANCLVSREETVRGVTEMAGDLGQRGRATIPKRDMFTEIGFTPHARFLPTTLAFDCETINVKTKISSNGVGAPACVARAK